MSLRWRIAVGLAVIAGIVCALAATGAYLTTKQTAAEQRRRVTRSRARTNANDDRGFGRGRPRPGPGPRLREPAAARNPEICSRPPAAQIVAARRHDHAVHPRRPDVARDRRRLRDRHDRRHRATGCSRRNGTRAASSRSRATSSEINDVLGELAAPPPAPRAGGSRRGRGARLVARAAHRATRREAARHGRADREHAGPHDADPRRRRRRGGQPGPQLDHDGRRAGDVARAAAAPHHRRQPRDAHAADEPAHQHRAARAAPIGMPEAQRAEVRRRAAARGRGAVRARRRAGRARHRQLEGRGARAGRARRPRDRRRDASDPPIRPRGDA